MKKQISVISCLAVLLLAVSLSGTFSASAAEAEKAGIDEAAYAQFLKEKWQFDDNEDGIITEEELGNTEYCTLDLTDVKDISWLPKLTGCKYLILKGGALTDFSILKQMPQIRLLSCDGLPVTDISFVRDMDLEYCSFKNMEQITLQQRVDVMQWSDYTIEEGYSAIIGPKPGGLLEDCTFETIIDDPDVAGRLNEWYDNTGEKVGIYGSKPGETAYRVFVDGKELYSGKITITPLQYISPELDSHITAPRVFDSVYYGRNHVVLDSGVLYGIKTDTLYKAEEQIMDFSRTYEKNASGEYIYTDMALQYDGTLLLNGEPVPDLRFESLLKDTALTADGVLYVIYPKGDKAEPLKVGDHCKEVLPGAYAFYLSDTGELIRYRVNSSAVQNRVITQKTGIMNPVRYEDNLFLADGVLWQCSGFGTFTQKQIAKNVVKVAYLPTSLGYSTKVYQTADGKYYTVYDSKEVEIPAATGAPAVQYATGFRDSGCFYIHEYDAIYNNNSDLLINWFITDQDILTIDLAGHHFAISDAAQVIGAEYDAEQKKGYAWFIRRDGTVWRYCFETKEAVCMSADRPKAVTGDANGDGSLTIADAVLLQKWLTCVPDTQLADWTAADLNGNQKLDADDLTLMKRLLLSAAS